MQHVRVLNLFINSIIPTIKTQPRKTIRACIGCGRFQINRYQSNQSQLADSTANNKKKYTTVQENQRPAEPSIAILKLATQGRPNEALAIYLKLFDQEGFPSREALYQLLRSLYRSNNLIGMYAVRDTLNSYFRKRQPSKRNTRMLIYMYTMLIELIINNTRPVDMRAITELCKELKYSGNHIVLYNNLIKGLLELRKLEAAEEMFAELVKNTKPTQVTFGIMMKDAARRKDIPRLIKYLDLMEQHKVNPDYAIVSILVTALCDEGEFDTAKEIVERTYKLDRYLVGSRFRLQLLNIIQFKRARPIHNRKK